MKVNRDDIQRGHDLHWTSRRVLVPRWNGNSTEENPNQGDHLMNSLVVSMVPRSWPYLAKERNEDVGV